MYVICINSLNLNRITLESAQLWEEHWLKRSMVAKLKVYYHWSLCCVYVCSGTYQNRTLTIWVQIDENTYHTESSDSLPERIPYAGLYVILPQGILIAMENLARNIVWNCFRNHFGFPCSSIIMQCNTAITLSNENIQFLKQRRYELACTHIPGHMRMKISANYKATIELTQNFAS